MLRWTSFLRTWVFLNPSVAYTDSMATYLLNFISLIESQSHSGGSWGVFIQKINQMSDDYNAYVNGELENATGYDEEALRLGLVK